jgi:hypothetical protein
MVRLRAAVIAVILALGLLVAGVASADPDFGTGNSSKKNNDPGAVCSPSPNKDADLPQCK